MEGDKNAHDTDQIDVLVGLPRRREQVFGSGDERVYARSPGVDENALFISRIDACAKFTPVTDAPP